MWQKHFPSPHLSYFDPSTLERLCAKHGFKELERRALKSLRLKGLWSRLTYDQTLTRRIAAVTWVATAAMVPFLSLLPADVGVQFFSLDHA